MSLNFNDNQISAMKEDEIDLMRYLRILFLHKWIFILVFMAVLLLAFLYAKKQPNVYIAEYEIFYNESNKEYILESGVPIYKTKFDQQFWLKAMQSAEAIKLTKNFSGLGLSEHEIGGMITVKLVESKDKKNNSNAFNLEIKSRNNSIIPVIAKSYVEALNELIMKFNQDNNTNLIGYLQNQLDENRQKLQNIDRQIILEANAKIGTMSDADKLKNELESFKLELTNRRIDLSSVSASRIKTSTELAGIDGTIVNESAFSEPLKVQLMNLQVDLARALTQKKEDHPTVKAIRENIKQISQMLRDSIEHKLEIKSLAQNPLKSELMGKLIDFQIQEVSLQTRIAGLEQVIVDLEQKLMPDSLNENKIRLIRNREYISETISFLNGKLLEANSDTHGGLSRFLMIDEPAIPTAPSSKGLNFFLTIGLLMAIILGAGTVLVYDFLDNKIRLIEDYEKMYPKAPILGTVLHNSNLQKLTKENQTKSGYYSENQRELAELIVRMKNLIRKDNKKVFSLVSPIRKEGKSFISYLLANKLANNHLRTLVIDADFYNPKLSKSTNATGKMGLIDMIEERADFQEIINGTNNDYLYVVSTGNTDEQALYLCDNQRLTDFIHFARNEYDVVIIDTPALLYIPDALSTIANSDTIINVCRLGLTSRKALDRMLKLLGDEKPKLIGTIINGVMRTKIDGYYKYDYYHYDDLESNKSPKISMFF